MWDGKLELVDLISLLETALDRYKRTRVYMRSVVLKRNGTGEIPGFAAALITLYGMWVTQQHSPYLPVLCLESPKVSGSTLSILRLGLGTQAIT